MERVITKSDPDSADVDLSQREHFSPSEWENRLLYGQYLIDRSLIRTGLACNVAAFCPLPFCGRIADRWTVAGRPPHW